MVTLNGASNVTVTVGGVAEDTITKIENVRFGSWLCQNAFGDADRWVVAEADAMH